MKTVTVSADIVRIFGRPHEMARRVLANANYLEHMGRLIKDNPEVAQKIGEVLAKAAKDPDERDYAVLTSMAAGFISKGEAIPLWLRDFAANAITGKIKPRARKGRRRTTIERDFALYMAVEIVAEVYSIQRYSNGLAVTLTAAEIVAKVSGEPLDVVIHAARNSNNFPPPVIASCPPDWGQEIG